MYACSAAARGQVHENVWPIPNRMCALGSRDGIGVAAGHLCIASPDTQVFPPDLEKVRLGYGTHRIC